jgi:hypothetical protein
VLTRLEGRDGERVLTSLVTLAGFGFSVDFDDRTDLPDFADLSERGGKRGERKLVLLGRRPSIPAVHPPFITLSL